ncbi:hypothetical protein DIPPA_14671 [Diplonema papillatum]|nr:hypothetical protein DIPPA_14671 [Diplonema papillatum]
MLIAACLVLTSIPAPGVPFSPMTYNSTVYDAFAKKHCLNPITISTDPYINSNDTAPPLPYGPDAVCAVKYTDAARVNYTLHSYASIADAQSDGSFVTHGTACGACSDLQDLSGFMSSPDLTDPVRKCQLEHFRDIQSVGVCISKNTNLTLSCALMFAYNGHNTGEVCRDICLLSWAEGQPNNLPPDNRLNDCLQCDEDKSGPIFKFYSGRSRRDSGLNSSIIRPASQVFRVIHDYY